VALVSGDITDFFVHTVSVETKLGAGAAGDVYAAPKTITGYLDGKTQIVRNTDGEQVVSQSMFYCSLADGVLFPPDSRVTAAGRKAQVIGVNQLDVNGMADFAGVEHTVIYLT
jgi:hypothetical protein